MIWREELGKEANETNRVSYEYSLNNISMNIFVRCLEQCKLTLDGKMMSVIMIKRMKKCWYHEKQRKAMPSNTTHYNKVKPVSGKQPSFHDDK